MRPNRITLACALSTLLVACAGSPPPGGDAGASSDVAASTPTAGSGAITGVGDALIVDGVPYDVSGATVSDDTDPGSPAPATLGDLQPGQHVDVELATTCRLSHIGIGATVVGLVDPGSIDTAAHRFAVLGQPISFSPAAAGTTAGAPTLLVGIQDASGLQAGRLVKVHGRVDAQGVIGARLVVVLPEGAPLLQRVRGVVSDADADARTFRLGALTVAYGAARVLPAGAKIADGEAVVVFSRQATTGTAPALTLAAETVRVLHDRTRTVTVRLGGPIVSVTPVDGQALPGFTLPGVKVDASRATLASGTAADLVVGAVVRVEGTLADGVLTATEITVLAEQVQRRVVLAGQVSSFVSAGSFVVRGTTVDASRATFTAGGSAAQLADGVHVVVIGRASGSAVVADQVTVQPAPERVELRLTGPVSDLDADAGTFRLAGSEVRLDPSVVWTGGTASDLADGVLVQVTGAFGDGRVFVAKAVRFLGDAAPVRPPLHLAGVISGVTADAFVLNNVTILVTSSTEIAGGPLADGQGVWVVAERDASGALAARTVQVHVRHAVVVDPAQPGGARGGDAPAATVTQLTGPISARTGATTVKVDAQLVDVSGATFRPAGTAASELTVGQIVTVRGRVTKGVLVATEVIIHG